VGPPHGRWVPNQSLQLNEFEKDGCTSKATESVTGHAVTHPTLFWVIGGDCLAASIEKYVDLGVVVVGGVTASVLRLTGIIMSQHLFVGKVEASLDV
jgi:hypothetical protein